MFISVKFLSQPRDGAPLIRYVALEVVGPPFLEQDQGGHDLDLELLGKLAALVREADLF